MSFNSMVVVRSPWEAIPITFLIGELGYTIITTFCLSIRFLFSESSLHIDEEVFDSSTSELTHILSQEPVFDSHCRKWHL